VCTLAIYVRTVAGYPLVVAANRDEFFSRPASTPRLLDEEANIFGGRDDVAGGTWLAVNGSGVVAALLNRRSDRPPDPSRRSRGLLCLSMLRMSTAAQARGGLSHERGEAYNPFNLLVADREQAWIATNKGVSISIQDLMSGLHLVTNLDLNDPTCPRIAASYRLFAELLGDGAPRAPTPEFCDRLRQILAAHDTPLDPRGGSVGDSLCMHGAEYGTRSSTLLFLDDANRWTYLHANDAPCRSRYHSEPVMEALLGR
jgi:uncharacterized protein with NRDE domain